MRCSMRYEVLLCDAVPDPGERCAWVPSSRSTSGMLSAFSSRRAGKQCRWGMEVVMGIFDYGAETKERAVTKVPEGG